MYYLTFSGYATIICLAIFFLTSTYILIKLGIRNMAIYESYIIIFPIFIIKYIIQEGTWKSFSIVFTNIISIILWFFLGFMEKSF